VTVKQGKCESKPVVGKGQATVIQGGKVVSQTWIKRGEKLAIFRATGGSLG
jgi:hypothetical protein